MPRRTRVHWPPDFVALHAAWRQAARGKRGRADVSAFEVRLLERLTGLQRALAEDRWRPGGYRCFEVVERGKVRQVAAAPFVDRVVHHALVDVLAPVWEARFLPWSCANRVGRGTHDAMRRARASARRWRYALALDVHRFFPSANHATLLALLRRHVKGPALETCARVIASGAGVFGVEQARPFVPAAEGLLAWTRPRGLPIGNQTSQFWANVLLHPMDLVVTHDIRPAAAVRYVDDLMLFEDDLALLERARTRLEQALAALRLRAHPHKTRLIDVRAGFTFVGYRIDGGIARLPRQTVSRFHRRLHHLQRAWARHQVTLEDVRASIAGMQGHAAAAGLTSVMEHLLSSHPLSRATVEGKAARHDRCLDLDIHSDMHTDDAQAAVGTFFDEREEPP